MSTVIETTGNANGTGPVVKYSVSDAIIAKLKDQYFVGPTGLSADNSDGYEQVRKAIGVIRGLRTGIESRRKELKADALEWGRKVDAEAKRLTGLLLEIEEPLKTEKERVDGERERARRAEEEEKLRQQQAQLADQEKQLEAQRAEFQAQQERANSERREQEEKARQEREALEVDRRKVEQERARLQQIEDARIAKDRADREASERAEKERLEAERLEAMKPDIEKIRDWGAKLRGFPVPSLVSGEAKAFLLTACRTLGLVARNCEAWDGK